MFGKRLLLAFCRAACSLRASAIAADGEAEDFGPGVRDLKSLLKLIDEGEMEPPEILSWRERNHWRKGPGRRATLGKGDPPEMCTSAAEEVALWRSLMSALHGVGWKEEVAAAAVAVGSAAGSGFAATVVTSTQQQQQQQQRQGASSAGGKTGSSGVATGDSLRARLAVGFDSAKESPDEFSLRMARTLSALELLGEPVSGELMVEVQVGIQIAVKC